MNMRGSVWGCVCASIHSAIHFISLRGLDVSGRAKVIRLDNPPNTAKILQPQAYSENLLPNFLFALSQDSTNIWSCFPKSLIPAAVEQQGIYRWVQCERRTVFSWSFALKKQLLHLVYFLQCLPPSPLLLPPNPHPSNKTQSQTIFSNNSVWLRRLPTLVSVSQLHIPDTFTLFASRLRLGQKRCRE